MSNNTSQQKRHHHHHNESHCYNKNPFTSKKPKLYHRKLLPALKALQQQKDAAELPQSGESNRRASMSAEKVPPTTTGRGGTMTTGPLSAPPALFWPLQDDDDADMGMFDHDAKTIALRTGDKNGSSSLVIDGSDHRRATATMPGPPLAGWKAAADDDGEWPIMATHDDDAKPLPPVVVVPPRNQQQSDGPSAAAAITAVQTLGATPPWTSRPAEATTNYHHYHQVDRAVDFNNMAILADAASQEEPAATTTAPLFSSCNKNVDADAAADDDDTDDDEVVIMEPMDIVIGRKAHLTANYSTPGNRCLVDTCYKYRCLYFAGQAGGDPLDTVGRRQNQLDAVCQLLREMAGQNARFLAADTLEILPAVKVRVAVDAILRLLPRPNDVVFLPCSTHRFPNGLVAAPALFTDMLADSSVQLQPSFLPCLQDLLHMRTYTPLRFFVASVYNALMFEEVNERCSSLVQVCMRTTSASCFSLPNQQIHSRIAFARVTSGTCTWWRKRRPRHPAAAASASIRLPSVLWKLL
jgi:hypothetical protein